LYFFCFLWLGCILELIIYPRLYKAEPVILIVNGLIGFTILAQFIALFAPVNLFSTLIILTLLLIVSLFFRKRLSEYIDHIQTQLNSLSWPTRLFLITLWLMTLIYGAGPILMDDTGSYHIQSIKWLQEFGTVPGIVNLHERYGFNSSWFSSIALFGVSSSSFNYYTSLNSFVSILFCFYLVTRITRPGSRPSFIAGFTAVLLFSLALWPLIRGNSTTANYDFITTVLVFILFTETITGKGESSRMHELVLWPVYLCTVRMTNFPLLIISFACLILLIKKREVKSFILYTLLILLLVIPFFIRNIVLTGYPFFPSPALGFFQVDWKPAQSSINNLLYFIKYYNRVSTTYLDLEQTKALGATGWIPYWFRYLFTYDKILLLGSAAGFLVSFPFTWKKSTWPRIYKAIIGAFGVQLIAWFVIAPDPRFIYGILLCGVFSGFYYLPLPYLSFSAKKINSLLMTISVFILIFIARKSAYDASYRNWMQPDPLVQPALKQVTAGGIRMNIPERVNGNWNPRCYGSGLPCLYEVNPDLEPRGKSLKNGFRLKKQKGFFNFTP